ncbi:MAG: T9SS type A sorting domain-containing protein, partial [Bacteroidota bacterium]
MKLLLLGLVTLPSLFFAQKHDFTWILGYDGGEDISELDSFGLSLLNFNPDTVLDITVNKIPSHGYNRTNTAICDRQGNLLFSSNGVNIYDKNYGIMEGGKNLNRNEGAGYLLQQGVLSLPHPRDTNLYAFFHARKGHGIFVTQTWYSEIDMRENDGLGAVVKMEDLVQDTLIPGRITAAKHGNGRDWWILLEHYCRTNEGCIQNYFYRVLLTPEGTKILKQPIFRARLTQTGAGQSFFTPDGTKYIVSHAHRFGEPTYIDIYDFDRCRGWLDNKRTIESAISTDSNAGSGIVISENSRFAYFIMWEQIIQYDLWANDIEASETIVAEYDGFIQYGRSDFPLATRFFKGHLAPDNKIYINTANSTQYLHVIHNPNEKGLACNVEQRGVYLPTYNGFSIPNHPNYRLGKWEGSPCDTLSPISSTEQVAYNEMNFFPNPSTGFFQLELDEDIPLSQLEIRFYSLVGQQVGVFRGQESFDLSGFASGIYVTEIWVKGKIFGREKIVL